VFAGHHGGHGTKGQLRRRRSTIQEGSADSQVSHRTRYRHQLGRYGKGVAPYVLQRVACGPRRAPSVADRSAAQSKGQQRENDTGKD